MKSYTVTANGIRQFVVEEGEGAPVILLHGFPETNYAWRYQIPVLSRHYRVIAPDLRGYGETDKPASGYDKRNMARDIRELMRAGFTESGAGGARSRRARRDAVCKRLP
jgi:pimeloyl-ACP methyl ester carboxylesterase